MNEEEAAQLAAEDAEWRQQQHEIQAEQWARLQKAAEGDELEDPWAPYREAQSWEHEMIDEPELEHEAGEVVSFQRWRDHGGRATGYPGAVLKPSRSPWIDGPTVAALMMLGIVLAPVAALVAWLARRLKVVRR